MGISEGRGRIRYDITKLATEAGIKAKKAKTKDEREIREAIEVISHISKKIREMKNG